MNIEIEDIIDPGFTAGLRSEVYLELFREGLVGGHAHKEIESLRSKFSASEAREAHAKETMAAFALKYADALQKIAEAEARAGKAEALLNDLFEMVWGGCPSLLRDHHLDDKIRAALKEQG